MNRIFTVLLVLLLGAGQQVIASAWQHWSAPTSIRDILVSPDEKWIWLATDDGIWKYPSDCQPSACKAQRISSLNGLLSNTISGLTYDSENVLWAVSQKGGISRSTKGQDFQNLHTAYLSQNQDLIPGNVYAKSDYLILGFEKSIAIWDKKTLKSYGSMTKIGRTDLSNQALKQLLLIGDTLFAITETEAFKAFIPFDSLKNRQFDGKIFNIFDPDLWKSTSINGTKPYRSFMIQGQQIEADSLIGFKDSSEISLWPNQKLFWKGDSLKLYETDVSKTWTSLTYSKGPQSTLWLAINRFDSENFITITDLFFCSSKACTPLPLGNLPKRRHISLSLGADGSPYLFSYNQAWKLLNNEWSLYSGVYGLDFNSEYDSRKIQSLQVTSNTIAWPTWGQGIVTYQLQSPQTSLNLLNTNNSCQIRTNSDPFLPVIALNRHEETLFWTYWIDDNGAYGIASMGPDGVPLCHGNMSQGSARGATLMGDSVYVVFNLSNIDFWAKNGSGYNPVKTIPSSAVGTALLGATDPMGRLWTLSESEIGIVCNGTKIPNLCEAIHQDTLINAKEALGLNNLTSRFTAISRDPQGDLWIGTEGDGIIYLNFSKPIGPSQLRRIRSAQGLLSDTILQLQFDPQSGALWALHPNGVSRFDSQRRSEAGNASIAPMAYPNPFRYTEHQFLRIRGIPSGSKVRLLHPDGSVLKSWESSQIRSGFLESPISEIGDLQPGVYRISIQNSQKTQMLNWIVIR